MTFLGRSTGKSTVAIMQRGKKSSMQHVHQMLRARSLTIICYMEVRVTALCLDELVGY